MTHETMPGAERAKRTSEPMTAPDKPEGLIAGGERGERELLPCPFCDERLAQAIWDMPIDRWRVECDCDAWGPREPTEEAAIAAWNRRALLSSPRVVETRRKALEEAALKVDALIKETRELCDFPPTGESSERLRAAILGRIDGLVRLAAAIRSLSPQGE